ncbi:hypothetical protein SNEBB_005698 [Seison nebaliae]|nr:hypothetical protein SNEBB_005698 [Seison nebaliae]
MVYGKKNFQPSPPQKGVFPLDRKGLCKEAFIEYMDCLTKNKNESVKCREQSKHYLECRMQNRLMLEEDLSHFGFRS